MKFVLAIYLLFIKGWSVIHLIDDTYICYNHKLTDELGHNGEYGEGKTILQAVYECYKKVKL